MCMKSTEEGCVLRSQMEEVKQATANLDKRLTQVENGVGKIRTESQDGFKTLAMSLSNLAHDLGSRMNSMDARLIEEKVQWGDTLRKMLLWTVRVILVGALAAMGLTAYRTVFAN